MSTDNRKSSNIVTLSSIVSNVLNEMNVFSLDNYERFMQLAIRGVKKLTMFSMPMPEVEYLTMNDSGIVDLPPDFVDYYKVGIKRNGQLWTLTVNKNLLLPRGESCGEQVAEENYDDGAGVIYRYAPHWYDGVFYQSIYGASGGLNDGYFRLDKEKNQLIIKEK